jgi:hypothetical protein
MVIASSENEVPIRSDGLPDAADRVWIHTVLLRLNENVCMIVVLRDSDYQRMAEEFVGIERKRLSVFVLHGPKMPN